MHLGEGDKVHGSVFNRDLMIFHLYFIFLCVVTTFVSIPFAFVFSLNFFFSFCMTLIFLV